MISEEIVPLHKDLVLSVKVSQVCFLVIVEEMKDSGYKYIGNNVFRRTKLER